MNNRGWDVSGERLFATDDGKRSPTA